MDFYCAICDRLISDKHRNKHDKKKTLLYEKIM